MLTELVQTTTILILLLLLLVKSKLEAALRARLDVETQLTRKTKAANEDKKSIGKRLVRAQDKAAQGTTPKLRSCSVTELGLSDRLAQAVRSLSARARSSSKLVKK